MKRANLQGTQLREADLREAALCDANLKGASLRGAKLHRSDLRRADLCDADLIRADLHQTNLNDVRLCRASLYYTYVCGAKLRGSDFSEARVGSSVFSELDLSSATGLDTVHHNAPSSLGIDTLYLSRGMIPDSFLRGAGVPENLIVFARSLVGKPIDFYSCFISYSIKDQEFAERLHANLQDKGVRCWFAPRDIRGGKKVHDQIDEAIRLYDRLLLILSEHSMNSEWVRTEIAHARQKELNERRQVLFPISLVPFAKVREWKCFDAETGKDSAREIREYFIPDFSNWKDHDSYQAAFQRLVRDLKAEESATAKGHTLT